MSRDYFNPSGRSVRDANVILKLARARARDKDRILSPNASPLLSLLALGAWKTLPCPSSIALNVERPYQLSDNEASIRKPLNDESLRSRGLSASDCQFREDAGRQLIIFETESSAIKSSLPSMDV